MPTLVVETPDDAWTILGDIAAKKLSPDSLYEVEAGGWPIELLRLPFAERSSISIPLMRALIEYQSQINRSYKVIKYDRPTGRLPRIDREQIELNIVVEPNGSAYNADVKKAIATLIRAAADKMESRHLTILGITVVLILATGYFGHDAFKVWQLSS
jgi:hypothetical protein